MALFEFSDQILVLGHFVLVLHAVLLETLGNVVVGWLEGGEWLEGSGAQAHRLESSTRWHVLNFVLVHVVWVVAGGGTPVAEWVATSVAHWQAVVV